MDPKPLSKEHLLIANGLLTSIQQDVNRPGYTVDTDEDRIILACTDAIRHLLAAEQYWREAVKSFVHQDNDEYATWCGFCGNRINDEFPHKPTCPWLLAQET